RDTTLPAEEGLDAGALESGGARQREARIEVRRRHTDLRVGGDDDLLGLGDVRPAREQLRWEPRRHGRGRRLVQGIGRDGERRSRAATQDRERMLLVSPGAL